jgi:hypothetical protein
VVGIIDLIYLALFWGLLALKVYALIDVARRPTASFPAVERLTKPIWLGILAVAALTHLALPQYSIFGAFGLVGLAGTVAAAVYLVDVRKRILELGQGPYGRW